MKNRFKFTVFIALIALLALNFTVCGNNDAVFSATPDAPQRPRLSWTDGTHTDTTMTIRWDTPLNTNMSGTYVNYGTTTALGARKDGTSISSIQGSSDTVSTNRGHNRQVHTVELTGLTPNTAYYYTIGDDTTQRTFKTAPAKGAKQFTVGLITDSQNDGGSIANEAFDRTKQVVDRMAGYNPDFVIHSGDVAVGYARQGTQYLTFLDKTSQLFSRTPIMPVSGNHDVFYVGRADPNSQLDSGSARTNEGWQHAFALPNKGEWYAYTYGNMRVINVFTGLGMWSFGDFINYFNIVGEDGKTQRQWIRDELAAAQNDSNITWIVINLHVPIYGNGQSPHIKGELDPIIADYPVDLVVAGHSHIYQRMKPVDRITKSPQAAMPQAGGVDNYHLAGTNHMVHIIYATAGAATASAPGGDLAANTAFVKGSVLTFSIMEVNDRTITWTARDDSGTEFDKFTITK